MRRVGLVVALLPCVGLTACGNATVTRTLDAASVQALVRVAQVWHLHVEIQVIR